MKKVFAEVGSSLQQVGGDCPDGWVEMESERPDTKSVATPSGIWEYPTDKTILGDREAARVVLNSFRDVFLNRLSGIAMFSEELQIKEQCSQLRTALLDITKDQDFLNATTYEEMEAALMSAYRTIASSAPESIRNVFRELEV